MASLRTLIAKKTPGLVRKATLFRIALLFFLSFCVSFCVLFGASVNARTNVAADQNPAKPLVVGVVPGASPPMEMSNPNESEHAVRGVSVDFAQRITSALQRPVQWQSFADRSAMIDALRQHRIDMATSATGNDAGAALLFSKPYVATKQVYVERRVAGSRTGRIAYVEWQTSPQRLQDAYPSMHPVSYRDTLSALLSVSLGDADAFVGDLVTAGYAVDHFDLVNLTISGFAPFDEAGYSFAFVADSTGEALRRRVDAALAALPPRLPVEVRARWAVAAPVTFTQALKLSGAELAWIAAHPVIDYSMYADAAPMTFRDSRGKPAGLAIDMLSAIGALTGLTFEGHLRGSVEAVTDDIFEGNSALIPYGLSAGRIPPQFVPSKPYGEGVLAIVTRAGAEPLHDARMLGGKRVALWRNHALMALLRERVPTARIVETSPVNGQFDAVLNGDADAAVIDMTFANYAVGNPYRGKLAITGAFIDQPVQHGFLIARGEPMLLSIVNKAIAHMQPAELDAIRRRWLLIEHPESKWEQRRPQVIFGALLAVALLALLAAWGWSLAKQVDRRRIAEQAMRRARNEAESANRAKSAFLAAMSHEICTPMNAVLGLLELELRSPGDRASTVKALGTAHNAARDLLGMIDDILDMAKIEAGRLTLMPAPVELGAWVHGVAAIYEPAARVKGLALTVRANGESEHAWVLADAMRLRQVLGNVLSNAIKFTDAGEVVIEYSIAQSNTRCAFVFTVSDTGLGIAADQQASLFAPFTQARQEQPGRFGGTGLGLTICRRLMTLMNGTIALSSAPGQGSRFTVKVSLPLSEPPLEEGVSTDTEVPMREGLQVLVVDDHPANQILLASQLKHLGCEIETASEGAAAFARWDQKRLEGSPFDLILTDCSMPVMSGEDLTRAIRKREAEGQGTRKPPIPIVGVTANAQREAVDHALASGMTQCLVKPLGLDALRRALVLASQVAATLPLTEHESHDAYARFFPVSDAPIRFSKRTARTRAYGPVHAYPSNKVGQQFVMSVPYEADAIHQADTQAIIAPRFNAELLRSHGDQAALLVDVLKWSNQVDLDATRAALASGDFQRLHELLHRMKGASSVIGATPFTDACVALQRLLERGERPTDTTELDRAYTHFHDEAIALDTALTQHAAPTRNDA
jgi:two-component system sensor histidine kinase EvgS